MARRHPGDAEAVRSFREPHHRARRRGDRPVPRPARRRRRRPGRRSSDRGGRTARTRPRVRHPLRRVRERMAGHRRDDAVRLRRRRVDRHLPGARLPAAPRQPRRPHPRAARLRRGGVRGGRRHRPGNPRRLPARRRPHRRSGLRGRCRRSPITAEPRGPHRPGDRQRTGRLDERDRPRARRRPPPRRQRWPRPRPRTRDRRRCPDVDRHRPVDRRDRVAIRGHCGDVRGDPDRRRDGCW